MRKENGPAAADEFMKVNLPMRGLGCEIGGLGAKTETGLFGERRVGKTADGDERDGAGTELERSAHDGFGEEEEPRGEVPEGDGEGAHYERFIPSISREI